LELKVNFFEEKSVHPPDKILAMSMEKRNSVCIGNSVNKCGVGRPQIYKSVKSVHQVVLLA